MICISCNEIKDNLFSITTEDSIEYVCGNCIIEIEEINT